MSIISSLPYTLINGNTADATQVMANFNTIVNGVNANAAANGANTDISSLGGLTTPISRAQGGTNFFVGGTSTGTANAQIISPTQPTGFAIANGNVVSWYPGFTNVGALQINVGATGLTNVLKPGVSGPVACTGGEVVIGQEAIAIVDGTGMQFILINPFVSTSISAQLDTLGSTQGDILYRGSASWAALGPGTAGQALQSGGAAANPSWVTPPFSQKFKSSAQAITSSGTLTLAHGLTVSDATDIHVDLVLKCLTSEQGYSVGDVLVMSPTAFYQASNQGCSVVPDTTNLNVLYSSNGQVFAAINKSTRSIISLTNADWSAYFRAWV